MKPYRILLDNESMVHMFSNRSLLANIEAAKKPIYVYSNGGVTHSNTAGTLENIGDVYLYKNGLANILSYAKVKDRHNITYNEVMDIFTIHVTYKHIHFRRSKRELYYHKRKPNRKKRGVTFVLTVQKKRGLHKKGNQGSRKGHICIQHDGTPTSCRF